MANKNCPLRQESYECDKAECAWWGNDQCSIRSLAHSLFYIEMCIETITQKR